MVLTAVLLVVSAAGGWFVYVVYGPKPTVEEMLPQGPVMYTRLLNPAEHWHKALESEFWKNVGSIDIPAVMARNNMPPEKITAFSDAQKNIDQLFKSPLIQKFLDKEIAFALYPQKEMVLVLRLSPSVQAAEFMNRVSDQWGEDIEATEEMYQNERVVHVRLKKKDTRIKYVRLKDLLFIAHENDNSINRVIDTYHRRNPSLKEDPGFIFLEAQAYAGSAGTLYISKEGMASLLDDEMSSSLLKTVGVMAYGASFVPGKTYKYKFVAGYKDAQAVPPTMRWMSSCPAAENASLKFIPFDVIGYQWAGCYDFQDLWQQAKEQLRSAPDGKYEGVEKAMNRKSYTDLIPLLGKEAGGYLMDVDTQGAFPFPRLLAFIKINDKAKAEEALKGIFKNPLGLIQEEEYNAVNIRYMSLPLGPNMDPAYCFLGDYLLLSTSRQLLKRSIDTYNDPKVSLKTNEVFAGLGLAEDVKAHSLMFLKVGDMAHRIKGMLDWGNKYMSSQVSMVSVYKQEGKTKDLALGQQIIDGEAELKLAQAKMNQLEERLKGGLSEDEVVSTREAIEHIKEEMRNLSRSIRTYKAQQSELIKVLQGYEHQAEAAKLFMFNSENVFVPIIKGLETIHGQGMTITASDRIIETEFFLN